MLILQLGLVPAESGANHMPGWRAHSYGYHGDDGNKFAGGVNAAYGPVFTTGDIVGCGVNNVTGQIFFTKNGMFLGYAFEKPATRMKLVVDDCYDMVLTRFSSPSL